MDQPHVIDGLDRVARGLGGVTDVWRFDRMATVCHPSTGKITASFAAVVKHYGVGFVTCPPRHGNRKGVVEKAIHSAAQRWWRTLPDDVTVEDAQVSLDRLCASKFDERITVIDETRATVAVHARRERLRPVTLVPFPATITVERRVTANGRVAYRGNFYSVPPELFHSLVTVTERLGDPHIDIATAGGIVIARHRLAGEGAGVFVGEHAHVTALEKAALAGFSTAAPHRRKERIPPGPAARAAAAVLRGDTNPDDDGGVVIDLSVYAKAAHERNTLP